MKLSEIKNHYIVISDAIQAPLPCDIDSLRSFNSYQSLVKEISEKIAITEYHLERLKKLHAIAFISQPEITLKEGQDIEVTREQIKEIIKLTDARLSQVCKAIPSLRNKGNKGRGYHKTYSLRTVFAYLRNHPVNLAMQQMGRRKGKNNVTRA